MPKFEAWFGKTIVEPYASKIPSTISYLCEALEIRDPWVDHVMQSLRERAMREAPSLQSKKRKLPNFECESDFS
jgi:hypothetical protein